MSDEVEPAAPRQIDLRTQDPVVLEEIELYSELIIVAAAHSGPLSLDQLDRALGVRPASGSASPAETVAAEPPPRGPVPGCP